MGFYGHLRLPNKTDNVNEHRGIKPTESRRLDYIFVVLHCGKLCLGKPAKKPKMGVDEALARSKTTKCLANEVAPRIALPVILLMLIRHEPA